MSYDTLIESTISLRGQTTLPKALRDALHLEPGDRVRYFLHGDGARIVKLESVDSLYGVLRHEGSAATLDEMQQAVVEGATG